MPGINADVVDESGQSVPLGGGGYLVLKSPWPSMARTIYGDPDRLAERLPALRMLVRSPGEIGELGQRLLPIVEQALDNVAEITLVETHSQIGSGALPVSLLPSAALALRPKGGSGGAVEALARALRKLPIPVIGRIEGGCVLLDLRCLEDEDAFLSQLRKLSAGEP
jgi:L-seryl-tRNA(Ser) seleniumtransferase